MIKVRWHYLDRSEYAQKYIDTIEVIQMKHKNTLTLLGH